MEATGSVHDIITMWCERADLSGSLGGFGHVELPFVSVKFLFAGRLQQIFSVNAT